MSQIKNSEELRKAIKAGNHTGIGEELMYSLDKKRRSQGLQNRSNSRTDMYKYGVYGKRYE